ncbi:MBL fold metallo-hydrolase [Maribellus maritimus]|uniref:MBL fold metallo-hydrolase n=1 Tax=Maribellus maritimus TaxID=2870838 RepID=UPI001EEACE82|nr:MBL fold metallo-hydrolase [Maribellus maritimus]MCG6188373.1 MBL fold metallo-hydrolase [Maribellus maritimus]
MIPAILIVFFIGFSIFVFLRHPKFGKTPRGTRLEKVKSSPNYKDGSFQNLTITPQLAEEATFSKMFHDFFFTKNKRPKGRIPSQKTNLFDLSPEENVLIWFGHSSYFIQIDGKKILVDPVFCGNASPFSFMIKAFDGTDVYTTEDIPAIDYLFITHDHWDHLDYKTMRDLKPKICKVITGLGAGEHLEYWGFEHEQIIEKEWYRLVELDKGFTAAVTPARHFSGRGLKSKQSLWASFVLQTKTFRIFIGGDGGYDSHFKEIGQKFGRFDLAILENGQYNTSWKYIHMMPEQVLQAARDLGAKRLFPVHNSKFALANHAWDEPLKKITALNSNSDQAIITPMIGEKVFLKNETQDFSKWWETIV